MAEDDNAVVEVSLKLASILSNRGEFDKACEGFQFCIETQEKKLKSVGEENVDEDTLVLWAMSHDWFARFLMNLGHYERAQSHFSRAYDVCVTVKGAEDPQAAVLLNDIGSVLAMMEKYDEALEYLNRAVDIGKKIGSEDLASFYVNLGSVYLMKKVLENAEQNCNRGMKLARKNKDETTIQASEVCLDKLKQLRRS